MAGAGPHVAPAPPFAPPYWAVIFTSTLTDDSGGYAQTAEAMVALAERQPGYLGHDSARDANGLGVTVSYWRDEASIRAWKRVADHAAAQAAGQRRWYAAYTTHVAQVTRAYAKAEPTTRAS